MPHRARVPISEAATTATPEQSHVRGERRLGSTGTPERHREGFGLSRRRRGPRHTPFSQRGHKFVRQPESR